MEFQVLMSTMNKNQTDIEKIVREHHIYCPTLVINQTQGELVQSQSDQLSIFSYHEKGLSKSRNRGLQNTNAEIALIADDDIEYVDDLENVIVDTFHEYKDYDIIAFYVETEEHLPRGEIKDIHFMQSLSLMSVQIAYRVQSIKEHNIAFDERFGTGSGKYTSGEENIFLSDCLNKGLKILYVPRKIAYLLPEGESSWFHGFDEQFFMSKGALFYRLSPRLSWLLNLSFVILKHSMYKKQLSMYQAYKAMKRGRKQMKDGENEG